MVEVWMTDYGIEKRILALFKIAFTEVGKEI